MTTRLRCRLPQGPGMRLMLAMAVAMEKEDMTTQAMVVGEGMKIQHTVTRLALQEPRRTARRNNHARCARLLDPAHQMPDVLQRAMMTDAGTLENNPRDQAGPDLVSHASDPVFICSVLTRILAGGRPPPGNFDSPFPAVPGGRDPRDRRGPPPRGGLEKGMAAMDINGRGPPPRPHTSNSNGRRPDMRQPPPRGPPPSRGRGGYPPGPSRAASSGRMDRPDRAYMDPNGPSMGPPGRSATMPLSTGPPIYPGQSSYQTPDFASSPMSEMPPARPNTAGGMRPPPPPCQRNEWWPRCWSNGPR